MPVIFREEERAAIEALLFVAPEPLSPETLSKIIGLDPEQIHDLIADLQDMYEREKRGIQIIKVAQGFQMGTLPAYAAYVEKLLQPTSSRLSRAALECLAIIAYRQPVTRAEIEYIRGVKADRVLATLLERELIQEAGRKETIGRPILYATTPEFLRVFGLDCLADLPPLDDFSSAFPAE
jgi:segregation and condensation protein B